MKISSFVTLKEMFQDSDKVASYNCSQYISPVNGIEIYIKAIDKISTGINEILEINSKVNELVNSPYRMDKYEIAKIKKSLAELYLKIRAIIDEFAKGFSLVHDQNITETISLLYRGFHNILNRFDLGYMTGKTLYYHEALNRLIQTRMLFLQMLEVLQNNQQDKFDLQSSY